MFTNSDDHRCFLSVFALAERELIVFIAAHMVPFGFVSKTVLVTHRLGVSEQLCGG